MTFCEECGRHEGFWRESFQVFLCFWCWCRVTRPKAVLQSVESSRCASRPIPRSWQVSSRLSVLAPLELGSLELTTKNQRGRKPRPRCVHRSEREQTIHVGPFTPPRTPTARFGIQTA